MSKFIVLILLIISTSAKSQIQSGLDLGLFGIFATAQANATIKEPFKIGVQYGKELTDENIFDKTAFNFGVKFEPLTVELNTGVIRYFDNFENRNKIFFDLAINQKFEDFYIIMGMGYPNFFKFGIGINFY